MILLNPQLIAFEAVFKMGTVHGAAELLFLTQTAVTQRLRMLEQKMKTTLFIRSRKGMLPTLEGEALHRYCQRVIQMEGEVLAQIQGAGIRSNIRVKIGGPSSIMRSRIIPQCEPILKNNPYLSMTFQIDDNQDLSQKLKSAEFDLVILAPEQVSAEMDSKLLEAENYLLVCSSKWKERHLSHILTHEKIIDFDASDQMSFFYLKHFGLLENIQPERHFVNNTESIAQLFIAGFGYGVLTAEFAEPYIKSDQLIVLNQKKTFAHSVALAWFPRPELPAYFAALIQSIR
ncbi:MAG: LysR family transcriptional regulator [Legionella longbeachae]|nr:LysR family transcriptional regulator [Legionella longbeachae]